MKYIEWELNEEVQSFIDALTSEEGYKERHVNYAETNGDVVVTVFLTQDKNGVEIRVDDDGNAEVAIKRFISPRPGVQHQGWQFMCDYNTRLLNKVFFKDLMKGFKAISA